VLASPHPKNILVFRALSALLILNEHPVAGSGWLFRLPHRCFVAMGSFKTIVVLVSTTMVVYFHIYFRRVLCGCFFGCYFVGAMQG
jgi:uncharacterized membrane protein